jgi:hypothetical protein
VLQPTLGLQRSGAPRVVLAAIRAPNWRYEIRVAPCKKTDRQTSPPVPEVGPRKPPMVRPGSASAPDLKGPQEWEAAPVAQGRSLRGARPKRGQSAH